jgi:glucose-6-phosphate 1-dehydrogenase
MTTFEALNPLRDALRMPASPGPATLVIFGASGDLTARKLMPAIYHLASARRLPAQFAVVGTGRKPMSDDAFREQMKEAIDRFGGGTDDDVWPSLARQLSYVAGDPASESLYVALRQRLAEIGPDRGTLFYLALPPSAYTRVVEGLAAAGMAASAERAWRRIVVEKPFGRDLDTARSLNRTLHAAFEESHVFRIDHYLGKETVQNLLVLRFGNGMFEPIWNRRYIDHVQITAAETVGVEQRAGYYEEAGALRDMVQNHLLQLLALVAMEPPQTLAADAVRDRKVDAVQSIHPLAAPEIDRQVVRARYADGWADGERAPGYLDEPGVSARSRTETFVALQVFLESWRWEGVPFYLRTGKRLARRVTEIAIEFKRPPLLLFRHTTVDRVEPNLLVIRVQPEEGISLRFQAKLPGARLRVAPVTMDFRYGVAFGDSSPDAYETLLVEAMLGDASLFARHDMVETAWSLITPVHERWAERDAPLATYAAGSAGPDEAEALMAKDGRRWRTL